MRQRTKSFLWVLFVVALIAALGWYFSRLKQNQVLGELSDCYFVIFQYYHMTQNGAIHQQENGVQVSWRVLSAQLFRQDGFGLKYQFNEEWNSPHNIDLAKNDIDNSRYSFRSFIDENGRKYGTTSFVRIAGKGTLGEQFKAGMEIPDGPANTILFLLWIDSGIPWMKPEDFDVFDSESEKRFARWLSSRLPIAVFADGSIRRIQDHCKFSDFRKMCTYEGGETTDFQNMFEVILDK